jgi:aspartyl protease family protein
MGYHPIYAKAAFVVVVAMSVAAYVANHLDSWTRPDRAPAPAPSATSAAPGSSAGAWGRSGMTTSWGEVRIPAGPDGHYWTQAEINGSRIRPAVVDTGASRVVLTYEDAATAGVFPLPADFTVPVRTANGIARMAATRLQRVQIGELVVDRVDALVAERGALATSLLGMSFLSRLGGGFEAAGGALILRR